ncbi:MAG: hypothetical protein PHE49_08760 [bacterium]|nr:hypothetical protein [bacterium]
MNTELHGKRLKQIKESINISTQIYTPACRQAGIKTELHRKKR